MIDIAQLTASDVGRWVWYKPSFGDKEKGKLKSWNSQFIFVVYKCAGEWDRFKDFTGAPTSPKDLEFIKHQDHCRATGGYVCACLPDTLKIVENDLFEEEGETK